MTTVRRALMVLLAAALIVPAAASARKTRHFASFETPSHHIRCLSFSRKGHPHERGIRCDLGDATNAPPPKPKSCEFDFGFSFGIRALDHHGHRLCVSDAVDLTQNVLHYGGRWHRVGVTCRSRTTGLTCRNHAGHGFFVSRDSQRVF